LDVFTVVNLYVYFSEPAHVPWWTMASHHGEHVCFLKNERSECLPCTFILANQAMDFLVNFAAIFWWIYILIYLVTFELVNLYIHINQVGCIHHGELICVLQWTCTCTLVNIASHHGEHVHFLKSELSECLPCTFILAN